MKPHRTLLSAAGALALMALPATAGAVPVYHPAPPVYHPAPPPPPPPHAKAYGKYCQGKSKKHVKGEKGTEFSRCVKAMARAAHNSSLTPRQACKGLSKKHVKGEKGTEFSRCVVAAAHLRRDERKAAAIGSSVLAIGQPEGVPPTGKGKGNGPQYTPAPPPPPGPKAGLPEQAKAYGRYCQGKSKKHVKGEKGTEFSRCVKAMAKVATNDDLTPRAACKGESRKHVKGEKGTPFSQCVKAAAQLREDQQEAAAA
jgi:hypothetical protein